MRLLVSGLILLITALDFSIGQQPGDGYQVASLCAGLLLALSVVADHLWLNRPAPPPAEPEIHVDAPIP
jgi:hypothetical protein